MSRVQLTFTRQNGVFVSNIFTIHGNTGVHIEKAFEGGATIKQRTGFDDDEEEDTSAEFDETYTIPSFSGCREADIVGYVFPKQVRIVCPIENPGKFVPSETMDDNIKAYYVGD